MDFLSNALAQWVGVDGVTDTYVIETGTGYKTVLCYENGDRRAELNIHRTYIPHNPRIWIGIASGNWWKRGLDQFRDSPRFSDSPGDPRFAMADICLGDAGWWAEACANLGTQIRGETYGYTSSLESLIKEVLETLIQWME